MAKKKTPEQEQANYDEMADNKGDNNITEIHDQVADEEATGDDKVRAAADPDEGETKAADKVEKNEKSAEEKLAEMQDKYLRLSAEFDNYRKRTLREKMDLSKYATEEVLLKILPVMDDFERALVHVETATDGSAFKSGLDLIYGKLVEFLKQSGIKEIESLNCQFNVDLHDAVAKTSVGEEGKKGLIVDVIQKGYYLQDKVIRHAKVVIGE